MKIRCDFVTNSSSSSFILGFKDKKSVQSTIDASKSSVFDNTDYRTECEHDYERLVRDCKRKGKDFESVLKEAEWEFKERAEWREYFKNNKFQDDEEIIKENAKKQIEEFKEKAKDDTYFVYVEYDDHESILDYLLRKAPYTLECFSHH